MRLISWIGWNASNSWRRSPKVSIHSHCTQTEYVTRSIPYVPLSSPFCKAPSKPTHNEFMPYSQVAFVPRSPFVISPTWFLAFKSSTLWVFWTANRPVSPHLRCRTYLCCSDQRNLWGHQEILVKVKVTLVQAPRLCTDRTAHRRSRGMAPHFHDHGTRRGEGSASRPGRFLPPGKIR